MGRLAQRDYAGALEIVGASMSRADGNSTVGTLKLLLYLLAKNGKTDEVRAVIATLDTQKTPAIGSFIDWFETKFDTRTVPAVAGARR